MKQMAMEKSRPVTRRPLATLATLALLAIASTIALLFASRAPVVLYQAF